MDPQEKLLQVPVAPRPNQKLDTLTHLLTAFVILMKGISKLEHAHEYAPFIALYFASSLAVFLIVCFHHWLSHRIRHLGVATYLIESLVMGSIAYLQFTQGSTRLGWPFLVACILFIVAVVVRIQTKNNAAVTFSRQGVRLWLTPFQKPFYAWQEIASITVTGQTLLLTLAKGKKRAVSLAGHVPVAAIQEYITRYQPSSALLHE